MASDSSKRILFLDLMRLLAILMMLQGHTIDTLLSEEYRSFESPFYSVWYFLRGFTGPLFMFTAGIVFNYLLLQKRFSLSQNERVNKGIKRGISLVLIGYFLRYPTYTIFDFSDVTHDQWLTFFSIDALHIIGLGLLSIIFIYWISSTTKTNNAISLVLFGLLIFLISPLAQNYNWGSKVPIPFANYFTKEYGSIFPIFPYMQYILWGAIIGTLMNKNQKIYMRTSANILLILIGLLFVIISRGIYYLPEIHEICSYSYYLLIVGGLLIVSGSLSLVSKYFENIPNFLLSVARNSLWIYIIHVIILYGSPWSIGLSQIIGNSFSPLFSILSALIMIFLMILISLRIDKFKIKMIRNNKRI